MMEIRWVQKTVRLGTRSEIESRTENREQRTENAEGRGQRAGSRVRKRAETWEQ
jgi:hypothetical protein